MVVSGRAGQGRTTGIMELLEPLPKLGVPILMSRETKRDENPYMALRDAIDSLILTQYRDGLLTSQTVVNDLLSDIENRGLSNALLSSAAIKDYQLEEPESGNLDDTNFRALSLNWSPVLVTDREPPFGMLMNFSGRTVTAKKRFSS